MKLEELRSRLIETCKGKKEFVEALESIQREVNSNRWWMIGEDLNAEEYCARNVLHCDKVTCEECPLNKIDGHCEDEVDLDGYTEDSLKEWANETLNLAIASCNGDEVKGEMQVFVVKSLSYLVGLISEDGKFRIDKDTSGFGNKGYEVVGSLSSYPYYQFDQLNFDVEQILGELGFRFTIQERKSYIEMLDECEGVEFEYQKPNFAVYKNKSEEVDKFTFLDMFFPGVKYIRKEDALRIIKECAENNG